MDKQSIASVIFSLALVCTAGALADSGQHGKGPFMALFDSNNDAVVTMDEFKKAAAERFRMMDQDNSGDVTKEEFKTYITERRQKRNEMKFKSIDSNEDGNISEAEYLDYKQKRAQRRFQRMDANSDGILSAEEFKSRSYGKWRKRHGKGGIFAKLDKNGDERITADESLKAWSDWFAKIDANGDSVVTAEEVNNYRNKKFNSK